LVLIMPIEFSGPAAPSGATEMATLVMKNSGEPTQIMYLLDRLRGEFRDGATSNTSAPDAFAW